jgi:tetratricopeptide (TPR) repeat protein
MKNQNENKAIQEYLYVLEIKPNRDAYLRLGNYYARKTEIAYNKGNYTQAEQKFDSSQYYLITGLNYWPDNSELNYNLGILYFLRNDRYEDSELRFNNVLKSTPGHRKTIETLVELYSRQRRFDKAKNLLQNGIEYHPGYARFYTELGIVYSKQGLYDEAIWNLEKAMELNYDLKAKYYLQSINAGLKKKNLKK